MKNSTLSFVWYSLVFLLTGILLGMILCEVQDRLLNYYYDNATEEQEYI